MTITAGRFLTQSETYRAQQKKKKVSDVGQSSSLPPQPPKESLALAVAPQEHCSEAISPGLLLLLPGLLLLESRWLKAATPLSTALLRLDHVILQ